MDKLDGLKPIYFPTECNLDTELFFPIARNSNRLDCMIGYFTSGSLTELARSISSYLASSQSEKMRFIVSPNLTNEDIDAIKRALTYDENLLPLLFPGFSITEDSLKSNSIKALIYLIVTNKLEMKVALKERGLFHSKCWLFETTSGDLAVHGSGNATKSGLTENFEQIVVSRSWLGQDSSYICNDLKQRFFKIWNNLYEGILCADLNNKTLEAINKIKIKIDGIGLSPEELKNKLMDSIIEEHREEKKVSSCQKFIVPEWLNYNSGAYAHQGLAVESWMKNNKKGILSIATGGGKTLTSLVASALINQNEKLFVVIAVPTTALLNQWEDDVRNFSINPINTYKKTKITIKKSIKTAARNLRHDISKAEVILITHDALKSDLLDKFNELSKSVSLMLIGDEVHNLGSTGFKKSAPEFFKYRMGLSATHERQFDEAGTNFLISYFGKVVFDYPLDKAIGVCLVPYKYFVHEVFLTATEEDDFAELTYKIKKLGYASDYPDTDPQKERWKLLCLQRRRIVESAENKINILDEILPKSSKDLKRGLIFCTDKFPKQLECINSILNNRSINFHQITSEETAQPRLLKRVLDSFNKGDLQVLTSKRVLDEGFNVPQTEVAYILASNTVRRQWIQRLGRVLRLSPATDKKIAVIHDFMVLPLIDKGAVDDDLISLVRSEHERLAFFSKLSSNGLEEGGSYYKIKKLIDLVKKNEYIV